MMALTLEGWGHDVKDRHRLLRNARVVRYQRLADSRDDEIRILLLIASDKTDGTRDNNGFQYAVAHQKP